MTTLYENNQTDNSDTVIGTAIWQAQTFTTPASPAHTVTSVKVRLWASAPLSGTITASIRATAAGKPTGGDLAVGTMAANLVGTSSPGVLFNIAMTTEYPFLPSTMYAVVLRRSSASDNCWLRKKDSDIFANGARVQSTDSGATWTIQVEDCTFLIYGNPSMTPMLIISTIGLP